MVPYQTPVSIYNLVDNTTISKSYDIGIFPLAMLIIVCSFTIVSTLLFILYGKGGYYSAALFMNGVLGLIFSIDELLHFGYLAWVYQVSLAALFFYLGWKMVYIIDG